MTNKNFRKQLKRGLGSAIIELMECSDNSVYKDDVLWCCLNDISFDWQIEGTKASYLYCAINQLGENDFFLEQIIKKFMKKNKYNLSIQLSDLLWDYVLDGNKKAKDALNEKRNSLIEKLPKQKIPPNTYGEREQLEALMRNFIEPNNFREFKKCVKQMGSMIIKHGNDECIFYDWLMSVANDKFGEDRVNNFFDSEKDDSNVFAFVYAYRMLEAVQKKNDEKRSRRKMSLDDFTKLAVDAVSVETPRFKLIGSALRFARESSQEELLDLAKLIISEPDSELISLYLLPFIKADFPLDLDYLISFAASDNHTLSDVAVEIMSEIKDNRLNKLAIDLLLKGDNRAFSLLINNHSKDADDLVRRIILKMKNVPHNVQMDVRGIYRNHKLKTCFDILKHIYRNGDCSFCRYNIIHTMYKSGCLPDNLIKECCYDSYDDTRKLAERLRKRRSIAL